MEIHQLSLLPAWCQIHPTGIGIRFTRVGAGFAPAGFSGIRFTAGRSSGFALGCLGSCAAGSPRTLEGRAWLLIGSGALVGTGARVILLRPALSLEEATRRQHRTPAMTWTDFSMRATS